LQKSRRFNASVSEAARSLFSTWAYQGVLRAKRHGPAPTGGILATCPSARNGSNTDFDPILLQRPTNLYSLRGVALELLSSGFRLAFSVPAAECVCSTGQGHA
jgi:hypothetical protein